MIIGTLKLRFVKNCNLPFFYILINISCACYKQMANVEFTKFLEDYIELHTWKNGINSTTNSYLRNVYQILLTLPTRFYLSENQYDTDILKNSIMTFLEADSRTKNDKELDYIKNRVFPAYVHYLTTVSSYMGVSID